jgi:hypothetical protein
MTSLPFIICISLTCGLALAYFLCYLLSWVKDRQVYSIAFKIGYSSVNIGFGVHLFLLLCGIAGQATENVVRDYGISLFMGGLAMLVTALSDVFELFRLNVMIHLVRGWLRERFGRRNTPVVLI